MKNLKLPPGFKSLSAVIMILIWVSLPRCIPSDQHSDLLVIRSSENFGNYTAEILKAEGLNEFDIAGVEKILSGHVPLKDYSTIILSAGHPDPVLWQKLQEYVHEGGNLISVIPGNLPGSLFGFDKAENDTVHRYIYSGSHFFSEAGITSHRIQIHSERTSLISGNPEVLAWFGKSDGPEKDKPAIILNRHGKGQAAAFLYNLPANIVLTRQGNPEAAGMEMDGISGLRAMDLFTKGWVDTTCNTINQADQQMRMLSWLIEKVNVIPLPKIWYFPDSLRCMITLTNDGEYSNQNDFESQFRDIDSMGAKMTLYVMETGKVAKSWTDNWSRKGFELSGHPDDTKEASSPSWVRVDSVLSSKISDIDRLFGLKMRTVVNHWFVWCGNDVSGRKEFAAQAMIEANHGIALDANYAHYDNNSSSGHFLGRSGEEQGNFNGSGFTMKFVTAGGDILNIRQHLNNVYDQQYNENHDPEGFFMCFRGIVDRSLNEGIYSFVSIKSHNDEYCFSKLPLLRMIAYANGKSVPVTTVAALSDFLLSRDDIRFTSVRVSGRTLRFRIESGIKSKSHPSFIIPWSYSGFSVNKARIEGKDVPFSKFVSRGLEYALCSIESGSKLNVEIEYGQ
jgi:hypothetical protein